MDSVNKKFKSRGDLTANAIQEIFNYMDSLKKTLQKKGFLDPDTTLGQFPVNNSTNNLRDSDTEAYVKKQDFKALRKQFEDLKNTMGDTSKFNLDISKGD